MAKTTAKVPGRLLEKKQNGSMYYYHVRTHRVKIDPSNQGKGRGSGKSKVVTETKYLGTADAILEKLEKEKAVKIEKKAYGLPCALWKIVKEIGLVEIVNRVVNKQKRQRKVSLGEYIALAAMNQVGHSSSKRGLGKWYEGTVLERITQISKKQLSSQHFWNAFDEIVSEHGLEKKKQEDGVWESRKIGFGELEELLDDKKIEEIEEELWKSISEKYDLLLDGVLYDGTNFYTFMAPDTAANIPQRGENKQKRNDKRQVGLALCALRQCGIPIFHKVYGGQTNEQDLFPETISRLIKCYSKIGKKAEKLTLIFDQGSNSQDHIQSLEDKIHFVGGLSVSNYPELGDIPVKEYPGMYKNKNMYWTTMQVYGKECLVIMTYSENQAKKKREQFNKRLNRVQNSLNGKIKKESLKDPDELKREIQEQLRIQKICTAQAQKYFEIKCHITGSGVRVSRVVRNQKEVREKRKTFGKRIIFTDLTEEDPVKVIEDYASKQRIEDDFKVMKDREYVSLWPMYHWTDTKIRMHAFVTVVGLLLVKLIEQKIRSHGLEISGKALVNELSDITECLMYYSSKGTERCICEMSRNQKEIYEILGLEEFLD